MFIGYNIFFADDDDADTKARVTDTKQENELVEKVKNSYDNMKPEVQALVDKARNEYEKITITDGKITVVVDETKTQDSNDPYKQNDDRYGGIEDKW